MLGLMALKKVKSFFQEDCALTRKELLIAANFIIYTVIINGLVEMLAMMYAAPDWILLTVISLGVQIMFWVLMRNSLTGFYYLALIQSK